MSLRRARSPEDWPGGGAVEVCRISTENISNLRFFKKAENKLFLR